MFLLASLNLRLLHHQIASIKSNWIQLKIERNDGLPDKLCKECTEKAYQTYSFKATIEQSDSTLRSLFKNQNDSIKKDPAFDDTSNYLMGIKTEIAFVDADPFIDDGDFDGSIDYAENTNVSNQQNESYSSSNNNNNNTYPQNADEPKNPESETDDEDDGEDGSDENYSLKVQREKLKKKFPEMPPAKNLENVEYIKDEEGKYVCQICNKKLVDKKGLNLHIRLHTGENLKRCHICNRGKIKKNL